MNSAFRSTLFIAAFIGWGCGSSPLTPAPAIMCPASQTVVSPGGGPVVVNYPAAVAAGGPGLTTSCSPASGSTFAPGSTAVSCSAVVSDQRVGCSFTVTVSGPPRLDATKFLAFGDSITYGSSGLCPGGSGKAGSYEDDVRSLVMNVVGPEYAYPNVLQRGLESRYTAQAPVVLNEGLPGEQVTNSDSMDRFINRLNDRVPEVLLLQEGINDLHGYGADAVPVIAANLRAMVRLAKGRGITVLVATLLPERPGGCRYSPQAHLVEPTNDQIRAMAAGENVELVDLYAVFDGHTDVLLAQDGLHPNQAGYALIAKTFFASIQKTLENPPPAAFRLRRP